MNEYSLIDAVRHRDSALVARLIEEGRPLEERDHRGSTPLRIATGSEQYLIAEQLVAAGADPFTMDSLYITAAGGVWTSNLEAGSPEGDARQRLIGVFKDRGVPLPPPPPKEMPDALKSGLWSAHAAPPPLSAQ